VPDLLLGHRRLRDLGPPLGMLAVRALALEQRRVR
jgi:hypothetical protein